MLESTGSMRGSSMPEWVTRTVIRRLVKEFRTAQSSGSTRQRVMTRTWLVRSWSLSRRRTLNVCGLTTGSIGSVARLKSWIGVACGRKKGCRVSSVTASSSLIRPRGVFISKFWKRWRTQYPQFRGQPTTWFREMPDLR
jgi:hypothetical protein